MYRGSCLCGAVRYEIRGNIDRSSKCWCTMCQKQHGSAFGPYANVASEVFHYVQGEDALTHYASTPGVDRSFCKVCGSNLTWQSADHSERIAVSLGTFDTPYEAKVSTDLYIESKPGWLP